MRLYTAIELLEPNLLGGSTRPWQVKAVRDDSQVVTVVVKLFTENQIHQYQPVEKEIYGYGLAKEFGLYVPEFGLIELTDDFVNRLTPLQKNRIKDTAKGLKFAVEWVEDAMVVDIARLKSSPFSDYEAPLVYAFDHLVWNGDRRLDKPNLLANRDRLILIDHEMCFCVSGDVHLQKWHNNKVWGYPSRRHLMFTMLKSKSKTKKRELFDEFEEYLRSLRLPTIDQLSNFIRQNNVSSSSTSLVRKQLRNLKEDSSAFRDWLIQSIA